MALPTTPHGPERRREFKKTMKKPIVSGSGRSKAHKQSTGDVSAQFGIYCMRILKDLDTNMSIGRNGMALITSFVMDMFYRLADEAARLVRLGRKETMGMREIFTAARLVLPNDLAKCAVLEAQRRLDEYGASKDGDEEQEEGRPTPNEDREEEDLEE